MPDFLVHAASRSLCTQILSVPHDNWGCLKKRYEGQGERGPPQLDGQATHRLAQIRPVLLAICPEACPLRDGGEAEQQRGHPQRMLPRGLLCLKPSDTAPLPSPSEPPPPHRRLPASPMIEGRSSPGGLPAKRRMRGSDRLAAAASVLHRAQPAELTSDDATRWPESNPNRSWQYNTTSLLVKCVGTAPTNLRILSHPPSSRAKHCVSVRGGFSLAQRGKALRIFVLLPMDCRAPALRKLDWAVQLHVRRRSRGRWMSSHVWARDECEKNQVQSPHVQAPVAVVS